jgi:ABC-type polysaccharide/polyol phosphate export permease
MRTAERLRVSRFAVSPFATLVWTLAQRDLKARFKGTLLGWLWSLIVPLATLGLYSLVFGIIFRAEVEPLGNGHDAIYALWLFIGLITFTFFSNGLMRGAESLRMLAGVLNRVRMPVLAPVLAGLISVSVQSLVEVGLYMVVLATLLNVGWSWLLLPLWAALFFVFTAGISAVVAVLSAHLEDILQFFAVLLQFLFFATPIMYPLTMIPADLGGDVADVRAILAASPLAQFVTVARSILYDLEPGTLGQWLALVVFAAASILVGGLTVKHLGADVAERLQ